MILNESSESQNVEVPKEDDISVGNPLEGNLNMSQSSVESDNYQSQTGQDSKEVSIPIDGTVRCAATACTQ